MEPKKNVRLIFLLSLMIFSVSTIFASNQIQGEITKQDSANVVCYEVFGMDCPGCQSALEKQIKKIDGVENAKASYKEKRVLITLKANSTVKEEEIQSRIKKANFTPGNKIELKKNE